MVRPLIKHSLLFILYGAICSFVLVIFLFINYLQNRPDLRPWHVAELDEEFSESRKNDILSLQDYQQLEERLYAQLKNRVYDKIEDSDRRLLNRYNAGSLADPQSYGHDWNRTFELKTPNPRAGVLLIHGLSDSPYSMRAMSEVFQAMGFYVVALRLPGHGTAPSGLLNVTWEDFAAATELAARHVKKQIGDDKPFYMAGFSTGAALAVEYSMGVLAGDNNPMPDGLVLLSPAIGVTSIAALAIWQERLSAIPGLDKAAWESIQPEFDPYKYKSFAVNAGDQIYELTLAIKNRVMQLDQGKGIENFPKVLAFQSIVDATISTPELVRGLFNHLAGEEYELVLFDINRNAEAEPVLVSNPAATTRALLKDRTLPFNLTVISNQSADTNSLAVYQKKANSDSIDKKPLKLSWPSGVVSLSHVALPFSPGDPVYGTQPNPDHPGIHLGKINVLGEKGLLLISANDVIRLRHNPFYSYLQKRVEEFVTPDK